MCRDERSSNKSCKLKWSEKQFDLLKNRGKITKIQTFDWGYDTGKNYFGDNGSQNYLLFQPILNYFKTTADSFCMGIWCLLPHQIIISPQSEPILIIQR